MQELLRKPTTLWSIATLILTAVVLAVVVEMTPWEELPKTINFTIIAVGLLVAGWLYWYGWVQYKREKHAVERADKIINKYQTKKTDYFSRKDALRIYRRISMLLREWRKIAEDIRATKLEHYEDTFEQNERVRQIRLDIKKVREECRDRNLDKMLSALVDLEWFTDRTYVSSPDPISSYIVLEVDQQADKLNQAIREHINKRIKN